MYVHTYALNMERRQFLSIVAVLSTGSIGATAYSTANVSRDVTVSLDTDENAAIGLTPSSNLSAISLNQGELVIDTETGSSSGLNTNASFTYGDSSSPSSSFAFKLTNNDTTSREFTFEITGFSGVFDGNGSLTFTFYDDTGTEATTVDASGSTSSTTLSSASSLFAVIDVDTTDLDASTDPSGSLEISAAASSQ